MERLVLKGGTVIDTHLGDQRNCSITIEGNRISAIEPAHDDRGSTVVNVEGKWLIPGMFNCHTHLGWDGVHDLRGQSEWPSEIQAYTVAMNIQRCLHAGITTVRDLGMCDSNIFAKRAVAEGRLPFIRLVVNGRHLSTTGGHIWFAGRETDGVDDCRKAVREQIKAGADWIKVIGCHDRDQFTEDELAAIVDEAHRAGVKVTAHATYDSAIRRVVEAGVDCVEHGGPMSDGTIQLMKDRGTWLVTTLGPIMLQASHGLEHGISVEAVERRRQQMAQPGRYDSIVAAVQGGVRHAFGTDAGSPIVPHDEVIGEFQRLVELGVCKDNVAALQTATCHSAELLGLEGDLGSLEVGKLADIVVLGGDPTADPENLKLVERVYVDGALAILNGAHIWPIRGVNPPLRLPKVVA